MKFGLHLPHIGQFATRDDVLAAAQLLDQEGFDSVWVADHVAMPVHSESVYPYRADGFPFPKDAPWLEAITTAAFVAGVTTRVQLGFSVLVLPMRHPVLTAKMLATLDHLSNGRVVVGLGVGWWREEFAALGVPFAERGRRCDEAIEVLRGLWREKEFSYKGRFYELEAVYCEPKPIRRSIPLWIGGGEAGFDRIVRLGDGWHAVGGDVEKIAAGWANIVRRAEKAGRDPASLELTVSTGLASDRSRTISRFRALRKAGVSHIVLNTRQLPFPQLREVVERFARDWRPEIEG